MTENVNSKALKSGVWYTISNFLMRSIGLITTPIFTRLLTHEEFGLYSNFTSWLGILTILLTLNLESTFISARYEFEDKFDNYIFSVLTLSSISCAIGAVILNIAFVPLESSLGMSRIYLNTMLMYILFLPAVNLFQAREVYKFEYKVSVFLSVLVTVGTAALSVLLVTVLDNKLDGRVYGSVIPTILVGIVLYAIMWRNGKSINREYWPYALKICLPFIPHLLSMTVLNSVDRIMITNICGAEDNALYSLAYSCASIISMLTGSLNTAFAPWLGEKLKEKAYEEIRGFSVRYILLFFMLLVATMIFTPEILLILGGESYLAAIYVMPPVTCGCMFQFLYTMFVNVEQFSKKTVGMAFASASAALLNYILNLIFIPMFGYLAAAYTTLAGFAWLLAVHMYLVYRCGLKEVYSYRFVAGIAVCTVFFIFVADLLFGMSLIRWIVGGAYLLFVGFLLYRNKNQLLEFVKSR